jgi:hypothetical protein
MANQELKMTVIDVVTGEVIERSFTEQEVKDHEAFRKEEASRLSAEQAKVNAKASALAKLAALGLTEEEIATF